MRVAGMCLEAPSRSNFGENVAAVHDHLHVRDVVFIWELRQILARSPTMSFVHSILLRAFGRPRGVMGKLGGFIMARTNHKCAVWVIGLLDIKPNDKVLEVGFGPGLGIRLAAGLTSTGYVAGVDPSHEIIARATGRNEEAIEARRVDLRLGSAGSLPFEDNVFDK